MVDSAEYEDRIIIGEYWIYKSKLEFCGDQTNEFVQRLKSDAYVKLPKPSNRNEMKEGYRRNLNWHGIYPNDRVTRRSLRRRDTSDGFYFKYGDFLYYPETSFKDLRYSSCQEYPSFNQNFKSTHSHKSFENLDSNQHKNYNNTPQPYKKTKFYKQQYENNNNNNVILSDFVDHKTQENGNKSQEKSAKSTSNESNDNKKEISDVECIDLDLSDAETICLDDDEATQVDNIKKASNTKDDVVTCETQRHSNKKTDISIHTQKHSSIKTPKNERRTDAKKIKIISNIEVPSRDKKLIKNKSQQNLTKDINKSKAKLDMAKDKSDRKQSCDYKKDLCQSENTKVTKHGKHNTSNNAKQRDNRRSAESIDRNDIYPNMSKVSLKPEVVEPLKKLRDMPILDSDDEHVEKTKTKFNDVNRCKDNSHSKSEKHKSHNKPVKHTNSVHQKHANETIVKRRDSTKIERCKSDAVNNNNKTKTDEKLIRSVKEKFSGNAMKKKERKPSTCDKAQESKRHVNVDPQRKTSSASGDKEPSTILFSNEDIQKLNNSLANLEILKVDHEKSNGTSLIDLEVEQIMCNKTTNPLNCTPRTRVTRSKSFTMTRGKSCIPFGEEDLESPVLSRSKSLEARDFLCYTPFRITRSMSRNWSLSSGLPNFKEDKCAGLRKRRQTIDVCEIPRKKQPSLFSEQTPFIKPREIDLGFTPRYQDEYVDEIEIQQESPNVTIIYNDVNPRDPRRKRVAKKINYNGRDLIKYTDYIKENSSSEQLCKSKEAVSKKISSRRKSVSRKNEDPDFIPKCKLSISPRYTEFSLPNSTNAGTDDVEVLNLNELQNNNKTLGEKPCSLTHNAEERISNKICMSTDHGTNTNNPNKSTNERKNVDLNETRLNTDSKIPTLTRQNTQKENIENESDIKKKKSLNKRIKHNDHVSSVLTELETAHPLTIMEPESSSASSFIQPPKLIAEKVTINTTKTYKSKQEKNRTLYFNQLKTPPKTLKNILGTLTSCIFMIRTLKKFKNTQCEVLNKVPVHKTIVTSEMKVLNDFSEQRLCYWIKKFHKICATLDAKTCDVKLFIKYLTMSVTGRDPTLTFEDFIGLLDFILKETVYSSEPENYISVLKRFFMENIKPMSTITPTMIHSSAQSAPIVNSSLSSETSTNSLLPQPQKNQTRPMTSSSILLPFQGQPSRTFVRQQSQKNQIHTQPIRTSLLVFPPHQLEQLKTQIVKYKQLNENMKRVGRKSNTDKKNETVVNNRNLGPHVLQLLNVCERVNLNKNGPYSVVTTNFNTPQKTPPAIDKTFCDPAQIAPIPVIPVTENPSQTVPFQFIPITVQNLTKQQTPPVSTETTRNKENKRTYSSDTPQVTIDLVTDDVNEEFVDLEKYFNSWNTKVLSETSSITDVVSVCVAEKESEGRIMQTGNVDDDPIPRSLSNDSGLESPSQVDCPSSLYENRACLCGKQAFYLCSCKAVMYCSKECQVVDWSKHKDSMEHNPS